MPVHPPQESDAVTQRDSIAAPPDNRNDTPQAQQPSRNVTEIIGLFADEPLWDEVMAEVKALRERQARLDERQDK